ncbi:VOC family protein [Desulfoprunum benzoelyticum]|nr:VOC family protein [Desulfoprunum benzoelyticum]
MVKQAKNTICLWYDGDAEEAARFYAETFPGSSVATVTAPASFSDRGACTRSRRAGANGWQTASTP